MDYHPVLDLVAVVMLSSLTIGFVSNSSTRLAVLGLLSTLTWVCVFKYPVYVSGSAWVTSVGSYILSYLWQYLDVGILAKWTYEKQGPETGTIKPWGLFLPKEKAGGSIASRLKFGSGVIFSQRFAGTPYQARGLPKLDEKLRKSRSAFLRNTFLTITACYLVWDITDASVDPEVTKGFYTLDKVGFLSQISAVSAEESMMRVFAALGLGADFVSVQRGVYSMCAFVAVALWVPDPQNWPPFNGPLTAIRNL